MTIYNKYKEVVYMPVETTGKAVDKLEKGFLGALNNEQPMKLPIEILEKKYELELSGIVDKFEEICKHFKGKKIAKTTSLSTLAESSESLKDAEYINKTVKPFIDTIKSKETFEFNDNTTLENVCQRIINVLKGMTDVFDLNLTSTITKIQKTYKEMTNNNSPASNLDVSSVSETVKLFSKAQTLIDLALEKHDWGSSDLQKDGNFKDKKYNDLKVSLGILNKKYQELKAEGDIAYKRSAKEIVTLYEQLKTFDHLKLDTKVTKEELDQKVANFQNMQEGIQCNPYDSIKQFLKEVRALEKEKNKNNAGSVIVTKKDAYRRRDLLKGKHSKKIQMTFFKELLKNNGFKETLDLINECLLRSQRLYTQLNPLTPIKKSSLANKMLFNTAVNTYFKEIQDKLTDTNTKSNIDISFTQLKENIDKTNSNWDISKDVVYCIGYIYIQLSDFVKFLTTNIETATDMLKEANGTLDKKDASKLKFGMDIYGKFATVAAFTGPLVGLCPIFAAIWGAVALSGTIVQVVQVVYNRHEAKKTDEARKALLKSQEEAAKRDDKAESEEKQNENPDDTGKAKEKVDTKTDNADVEKLKEEIADTKSLYDALKVKNKKLKNENENYKKRIEELEAKLAKLESENA